MNEGKLSQLQLEGVLYACTKHQELLPSGQRTPCSTKCTLQQHVHSQNLMPLQCTQLFRTNLSQVPKIFSETIVHGMTGAGFFIGDGAGVGKGRQIAGIILDNYVRGRRRAVWLSTSTVSHSL